MVFGAVLHEEWTSDNIVGSVGGAVGVEYLAVEVHLHDVGLEEHAVIVNTAVGIEVGTPGGQIHGHRVFGLVLDDLVDGIARNTHQRVDVPLRRHRKRDQQKQKVNYVFRPFQTPFKTLF